MQRLSQRIPHTLLHAAPRDRLRHLLAQLTQLLRAQTGLQIVLRLFAEYQDLDGAFGKPRQTAILRAVLQSTSIPVEVGGGLRTIEDVEAVLEAGARWAIVGTRAALDPAFLGLVCERFLDQVIIGIDASDGKVAVDGWQRVLDLDATALARDAAAAGAAAVIYTDIARDGMETGPNLWTTEAVARAAGIPLLASGGVGSLEDIRQLATVPAVTGVIVGRALYSGAVELRQALAEVS